MEPGIGVPPPEASISSESRQEQIGSVIDSRLADGLNVLMNINEQAVPAKVIPGVTLYRKGNAQEQIRQFASNDRISSNMVESIELSVADAPKCSESDFLALAKQYGDGKLYERSTELGVPSFNVGLINKTEQSIRTILADRGTAPSRGVNYHLPGLQAQWRARARLNRADQVAVEFFRPKQEYDQDGKIFGKKSDGSAYYLTPYILRHST